MMAYFERLHPKELRYERVGLLRGGVCDIMKRRPTVSVRNGHHFIYLFIYLFIISTIKITQALHYTKMWRGDLRKPQGLYEEAPPSIEGVRKEYLFCRNWYIKG